MINLKKSLIFALFLILLISIYGCKGKKSAEKSMEEIRTGTQGIMLSFMPNAPPDKIVVERGSDNTFDAILELRNKGAFPQPEDGLSAPPGRIYLSGYDPQIISFGNTPIQELSDKALEGKSTINPNGGLDLVTFKGTIDYNNLNVEKYEPTLLATACYQYLTVAGPSVCIDPDPYSTITQKKVCQVQGITLSNQGAPVAVTKIDEEAFAKKIEFRITIKNVGGGEVIKRDSLNKCGLTGDKIGREDIDKVLLAELRVGTKILKCGPFTDRVNAAIEGETGYIRLINGEGVIICRMPSSDYGESKTSYTTPMTITLIYGYRSTAERKIMIKREGSSLDAGTAPITSPGGGFSQPSDLCPQRDPVTGVCIGSFD